MLANLQNAASLSDMQVRSLSYIAGGFVYTFDRLLSIVKDPVKPDDSTLQFLESEGLVANGHITESGERILKIIASASFFEKATIA